MSKEVKTALIIGGVILALLLVVPSILGTFSAGSTYGYGMMGPGMMGGMMGSGMMGGFGWMGLVSLFWIVLLGVIIWAIVAWARSTSPPTRSDSALEILKTRYARGEINKPEYEEKKKDLA